MGRNMRRSIGKVDRLPPEHKAAVEQMLLANQSTYREIVAYLAAQGHQMSQMAICNFAKKYLANVQILQIAQENFRMMMDAIESQPNLDTTEAIMRLASQHVFNALAEMPEERWQEIEPDKLLRQANGLIHVAAYKNNMDIKNQATYEAGLNAVKSMAFDAMAKKDPALYKQVAAFLKAEQEAGAEQ